MSLTHDDSMESIETISEVKEKAFYFDKLDMNINLDDDFDKLSSNKTDFPDLHFSLPSEKDSKAEENSKEETNSGRQQERKDCFTFSFNFNVRDGFDFVSSLTKGEKTCKKSQESEAVASENTEVSKTVLKLEDDCITAKFPASGDATISNAETSKGGEEACHSIDDSCPSKAVPVQELVPRGLFTEQGLKVSQEKTVDTIAKETNKLSSLSDMAVCSEIYDLKSLQNSAMDSLGENNSDQEKFSNLQTQICSQEREMNMLPIDSLAENNLNQETLSKITAEVCSQSSKINSISAVDYTASDKNTMHEEFIHDKLIRKNSFLLSQSDKGDRKGTSGNMLEEIDDSQSVQGDIILKDISTASLSREILDNSGVKKCIQGSPQDDIVLKDISTASLSSELLENTGAKKNIPNSTPKLLEVSLDRCSEPTVSELTAKKDKQVAVIRLRQTSATGKDLSSFNQKKIGDMHLCPEKEKREDISGSVAQNENKLVGYSKICSQELTKGRPLFLHNENNVGSSNIRDGFNVGAVQVVGSKSASKFGVQHTTVIRRKPVLLGSKKNVSLIANPFNYAEKKNDPGSQISVNPNHQVPRVESIQNSKFLSEAHKIAKKAPAFSSSTGTRVIGPNEDQLNPPRETSSLTILAQNKDMLGNKSEIVLPVQNTKKLAPKLPFLKRKTFEESNGDLLLLKPRKRHSASPSESRNPKESPERVDEEVQIHKNHIEDSMKNILCDKTTGCEVPGELNMTEPEFPTVMDSHGIVEKAEAYEKELEGIYNMLKRKHEEAKELLVRAIANNNNVLMLNHPIFQEKINMIKKFAKLYISKEMST